MEVKRCSQCGETKPLAEFRPSGKRKDGTRYLAADCYECHRQSSRRYRNTNLEACRARELAYARTNAERKRENASRWYHSSEENRAKAIAREAAKYKKDPEYKRDRAHQTRARTHGAQVVEFVRRREVYERDQGVCHICEKPIEWSDYDMDHLTPLSLGGDHSYANVRASHRRCNRSRRGTLQSAAA